MVQGTASDAGKSLFVAGLCRAAVRRGLNVRPFKPQNMSNNAAVTPDGGEIGRAQALQALAARVPLSVHMNPVLLKPETDRGAQIVVQGRVFGHSDARRFGEHHQALMAAVLQSFNHLSAESDLVVVEGAGSASEVNLRARDIANMGFARAANVPVVVLGDIDRGGVIANLVGTRVVLPPADSEMICGYVINKFRGDVRLFDGGLRAITEHTGWPSFGVVPWFRDAARLPAEDAVSVVAHSPAARSTLRIVVPMLSRIANFDDLDPLREEPTVELTMVAPGRPLPQADVVLLPGTKSTLGDLGFLRAQGWDIDIQSHARHGGHVFGVCGGFQLLGTHLSDPDGVDGPPGSDKGLGLLKVETRLSGDKRVRPVWEASSWLGPTTDGYEIHVGETSGEDCARPVLHLADGPDGARSLDGKIAGTYVHGLFGKTEFRHAMLAHWGAPEGSRAGDYADTVDRILDDWADHLERHIDLDGLLAHAR